MSAIGFSGKTFLTSFHNAIKVENSKFTQQLQEQGAVIDGLSKKLISAQFFNFNNDYKSALIPLEGTTRLTELAKKSTHLSIHILLRDGKEKDHVWYGSSTVRSIYLKEDGSLDLNEYSLTTEYISMGFPLNSEHSRKHDQDILKQRHL
jgi:hypothetical protein